MDELLAQFLIEGPELVQQGAEALLALEHRPGDRTLVHDAFRAIHTLKGSVGLFDLPPMAALLHAAEDVLAAARGGTALNHATVGRLLKALDQTQAWLAMLDNNGALPEDAAERSRQLTAALAQLQAPAAAVEAGPVAGPPDWALAMAPSGSAERLTAIRYTPDPGCYFAGDDPLALLAQTPGLIQVRLALRPEAPDGGPYDPFTCTLLIEALSSAPVAAVRENFRFLPGQVECAEIPPQAPVAEAGDGRAAEGRALRIDAARVESLAAVADELITAKSGLGDLVAKAVAGGAPAELAARFAVLDRLTAQLHHRVAGLRMAPVRQLLRRFPRVARDLSESLGKQVELVIEGGEVEADRRVVEGLFEPLTHLLRNAIDHGVENAAERRRLGKPEQARITIAAAEKRGLLSITVRDDGSGIDAEAIRASAARKGLVDPARLAAMSDAEAIELVFLPGFSTAATVTAVSGRGVGMDAIRTAVRRLGGHTGIETAKGQGTAIELSLPLTVSLTQVMVVAQGGERFGLPLASVIETLRLVPGQIVAIRASHAFNWRDQAIPLLPLASLTGAEAGAPRADQRVVVVRTGSQPVGLAIDGIEDRLAIAVRPLQGLLAGMQGLAGAAVMGDGQVLMILDPEALIG